MDQRAVDAAQIQLNRAVQSLNALKASNDLAAIETHWAAFLESAGRVFTKLEQGSKASGTSKGWWGRRLHERRTDPLLCYLWHARNADAHTLQQISELKPGRAEFVQPTEQDVAALHSALKNEKSPHTVLGLVEVVFQHVLVVEVIDKGDRYAPPNLHLGAPVTDITPAHLRTKPAQPVDGHLDPGRFPRERLRSRGAGMTPVRGYAKLISHNV